MLELQRSFDWIVLISLSVFSSMEEVLHRVAHFRAFLKIHVDGTKVKYWVAAIVHFHERNYWTELYLNATLRHDWTAGKIFLPLVDHHETTKDEVTFHIGGFLRRPSEVKRRPENGGWNPTQDQQWHHHDQHHLTLHDGINISWSRGRNCKFASIFFNWLKLVDLWFVRLFYY